MTHTSTRSLLALAACVIVGCGQALPEAHSQLGRNTSPLVPAADLQALVTGNTTFAANLHHLLAKQSGNLFYSPFSISLDMAMINVIAPANGDSDIVDALQFTLPADRLNAAFDQLDLTLTGLQGATENGHGQQLRIASALWSVMGTTPSALDTLAQYYGTGVLNGKDPGQEISAWAAQQSNLPPLPFALAGPTDLAVVDLVAFDAAWQVAFDPSATHAGSFQRPDGSQVSVPFMNEAATFAVQTSGTPAIELPYDGGGFSMLIVMPDDLASFEANLSSDTLGTIRQSLKSTQVSLSLPKFDLTGSLSVLSSLKELGVVLPAGGVWEVWHSAKIQVSERGTQAEAMTTASHSPSAVLPSTPFVVNKPFDFFIQDQTTGTIVFAGRVVDPTQTAASMGQ